MTIYMNGIDQNRLKLFRIYGFVSVAILFFSCSGRDHANRRISEVDIQPVALSSEMANTKDPKATIEDQTAVNVISIFQDQKGDFWFGTQSEGMYHYNGRAFKHYTEKDGLVNNQVQTIQEDKAGNIWFGTGRFGVSRFDGRSFETINSTSLQSSTTKDQSSKIHPEDLWFYAGGGVYRYDGMGLTYLSISGNEFGSTTTQYPPDQLSPYAVYCSIKDKAGILWLGTQSTGVCRYDGKTFTWFTEQGLAGPAVLGLFEDREGNLWFGNNGKGLFKYEPSTNVLTNITAEKGLSNDAFLKTGAAGPGTLARIYSINEDRNGALWVGTVDAGVWRIDGDRLTNYTTLHGLPSNAVTTIYKDRNEQLWFGTELGVCTFNGISFTRFEIQ